MRSSAIAAVTATVLVTGACHQDPDRCVPAVRYQSQFSYTVHADELTPKGIQVDRSGQAYPTLQTIDDAVDDVEQCLIDKYMGNDGRIALPKEVMEAYDCRASTFPVPLNRACLTVKIPDDWFLSDDGTQELLSYAAPVAGCEAKGLEGDGCFWRAGLQCSNTVVSTPSLYVFNDPLIRSTTGCNNPWGVRIGSDGKFIDLDAQLPPALRLTECASPNTTGMSPRSPLPGDARPDGFPGNHVDFRATGCGY